jgi:hypothetical protein
VLHFNEATSSTKKGETLEGEENNWLGWFLFLFLSFLEV